MSTARLDRAYTLGDKFDLTGSFSTPGASEQITRIVAVASKRHRAAVRHLQYDRLVYHALLERFQSPIQFR